MAIRLAVAAALLVIFAAIALVAFLIRETKDQ